MSKKWLLGCGIAAAVGIAVIAVVVIAIAYLAQDAKGVGVSVDSPADVLVGQTFDLSVTVTNERPRKKLALSDIDLAEGYLAGFTITGTQPAAKTSQHVPVADTRSFTFGVNLAPKAVRTFTFTLRAEKAGIFRGDVDVWEGAHFVTSMAQTVVKERSEGVTQKQN